MDKQTHISVIIVKGDLLTFQTTAEDYNFVIPITTFGFIMTSTDMHTQVL